jgi:diguanylate cyclase (GGDEF)-like protein/PAS domain S-box-containing protein
MNQFEKVSQPQSSSVAAPQFWTQATRLILVTIIYGASAHLGLLFMAQPEGIAAIWLGSGVALAALLISPKKQWGVLLTIIFSVNIAGNMGGGNSLWVSLGFALANTLEPLLGAWALIYFCGSKITFGRVIEIFALFGVAIISNAVTALPGAAVPALAFGAPFWNTWQLWWIADGLGMVLVTPFIVTWVVGKTLFQSKTSALRVLETAFITLGLAGFAWLLFGKFTHAEEPILRNYMLFPILILLAFRYTTRGMSSVMVLLAAIAIWNTLQGYGIFAFADQSITQHLISLQMLLGVITFSGLFLSAVLSERRHAETALRESEDKFKYIFDHSSIGKSITLLSGKINANQALCNMLGYTQAELQSMKWQEITHPEDVELTQNEIGALISREKEMARFSKRYIHKNGSIIWTDISSVLRRDENDKPLYLVTAISDITALKQAEEELLESKLTAERYLNIAAEIIVSLDPQGNIMHLNESGHQLLEYDSTKLIGKNWFDTCLTEEERVEVRRFFEMLRNGEVDDMESRENSVVTKNGEKKIILWHNTILRDREGRFTGTLSSGEDITNRIEMETAMRIALAKYKTLFESFPMGITIADGMGNVLETNPTAEKLLAVSRDDHAQRSIDGAEWRIVRADGTPMPPDEFASVRALKEKRKVENVEMGIVKPNHSTTWLSVTAAPLPVEGHGIVITYGDITARKRAEDTLQARVRISQFAESHTLDELLQKTLDEAETVTGSQIGFFHFLKADQKTLELQTWSTNTLNNMCKAEGKGRHYAVEQAGVWVECIYSGAPVIHNDYASLPASRRKGMPVGHAPVIRELVVPVVRGDLIVAIFGVGNKPAEYTDDDVNIVLQLANLTWDIVQRKRAEEALQVSEKKYRLLHETMTDGFVSVDMDGNILECNPIYTNMLGYSKEELASLTYLDITPEKWRNLEAGIVENQIIKRGYSDIYEKEYIRKDGSTFPAELHTVLMRDEHGKPSGMWAIVRDITERKRAEKVLQESESRFRTALQEVKTIAVQGYATDGTTQYWNSASENLYGYSAQEAIGRNLLDLIIPPEMREEVQRAIRQMTESGRPLPMAELSLMRKDGSRVSVYSSHVIVPVAGHTPELFCLDVDLTQRKQAEKALETANTDLQAALLREKELAHTDMLTGVNNRRHLYELATHELDIAIRYRQPLSLLMFDLDHFKQVNDTFGHTVGDQILVQVTQTARAKLRSTDSIGRYGGEEFVILLPMTNAQHAFSLAERIRESVAQICVPTPTGNAAVTLSIGIVEMTPTAAHNESLDDLIRHADQAMYAAKQSGRNRTLIFNSDFATND